MSVPAEIERWPILQGDSPSIGKILQGDCIELMRQMPAGAVDLVFADPPFNIGYEYDTYHDRQDPDEYIAWCRSWIAEIHRVLKPSGTFWLAIGDEYAAELKVASEHQIGFTTRSWVVWYYTFGVNCTRKFSRSHAHLFHFVKDASDFTFNAEDPQVRVPSARALVYADKRANPLGRLPDDTWILRPQDLPDGFQPADDTWYFARVAGTFKERQGFHGCQMPEQLLGRIIRASSKAGDVVLDPFAGSGTTLAVAKKLGRQWIGCELSEDYVRAATERLSAIKTGDPLDGPPDPIASAPSTVDGKRLSGQKQTNSRDADHASGVVPDRGLPDRSSGAIAARESHQATNDVRSVIRSAIINAFYAAHDGYSIDWLLANALLQADFHQACRNLGLIGSPADWNRELLRLRKTGDFPKRGKIKKVHVSDEELDAYSFASEIAWRMTSEKFGSPSLDEILCDPAKANFFDRVAKRLAHGYKPHQYRWAALRLRKASHHLVNEVKQFHFVFATRDFGRQLPWRRLGPGRYSGMPGIYLLREADNRPLYVGHALDLGRRLSGHAACRAFDDLTPQLAVISGIDLPGAEYQPAFKEHLVRRYVPRWNMPLVGLNGSP